MKNLFLLSIFALTTFLGSAQFTNGRLRSENKHLLYSNMDFMVGNSSGGSLGMSFVYNSKFSIEFGYSALSNQFNSIPKLKSGNLSDNSETTIPGELIDNFNLMFGRHFKLNERNSIRFVLQGGPGISVIREAFNRPTSDFNHNELSITSKSNDFNIIINSKFEFPLINVLGFSAGPTLVMNHEKCYITFCVGFIYGIISTN